MFHKSVRIPLWVVVLALMITSLMAAAGSAVRMDTWEKTSFLVGGAKSAGVILKDVGWGTRVVDVRCATLHAGDVIVAVNGDAILNAHDLELKLASLPEGSDFRLRIVRNGARQTIAVKQAGAETLQQDLAAMYGLQIDDHPEGVLVTDVNLAAPAGTVGLRPGDVIRAVNGILVHSADEFRKYVSQLGSVPLNLEVRRNGQINFFLIGPRWP